jgi:ABC-type transport system substrate-binding protein
VAAPLARSLGSGNAIGLLLAAAALGASVGAVVFSRLTIVKPGIGRQSSGEIGGDLAEGWEFSPDGLTMTYRLRQNAHWHDVPPVGGRLVDTQDVVASWNRWRVTSGTRTILDHDASPAGLGV